MSDIHQLASKPPGVLPRNAQYILLGTIAALILGLSFCSGPKTRKDSSKPAENPIGAATTRQMDDFRAIIKAQNEADIRRQQLQERLRQAQEARQERQQPVARAYPRPERDPSEELERQRRARAPFAPLTVVVAKETAEPVKDVQPQLVYRAGNDEQSATTGNSEKLEKAQGSGVFLPERDGDLFRIYEGTLVKTALMNRLDGTFTGPVMCIVTEPVVAKGNAVLIPAGAKFLGEARRVEERNQQRLAVWFDRLLLPNGYSIPLEKTPGLNTLGETGLRADKVNNHYLRRFSFAGAIGLLGGLRLYGGRPEPFGFESGVAASLGSVASSDLQRRTSDVPTITIREGHVVNIYLANDLLVPEYSAQKGTK